MQVALGNSLPLGLMGDYNPVVTAHQAIPAALRLAGEVLHTHVHFEWIPIEEVTFDAQVAKPFPATGKTGKTKHFERD